ncbi:MAG: cell division protein FtsW [Chthoniobacterales bacterium]|nr:cell division protein FtsW [Chthoniobacterales bacterium]
MHRKSAYFLFLAVLGLLAVGAVIIYSTGAFAKDSRGDSLFFIRKHAIWLGAGLIFCCAAALIDYHFWQRTWAIWFGVALVALAVCFLRPAINGSHRWIVFHGWSAQPSEFAKLAAVFFLAFWFSRYEKESAQIWRGFVLPLAVIGLLVSLIVTEVDLGTTALLGATTFVVMFIAGTNLALLGALSLGGIGGILFLATHISERMARLTAFLHPEEFKQDAGLQQMQALIAWGSGGISGRGLGLGRQKMLYLPYAHTDFIFPIIGEELGLRFSLLVVFLFVVVIVCGLTIALHARDRFGLLLASGIVSLLAWQAAINIGVVTSLLPNKGMPLPFISYGGSNLIVALFAIGVLLNIYRQGVLEPVAAKKQIPVRARITPRI